MGSVFVQQGGEQHLHFAGFERDSDEAVSDHGVERHVLAGQFAQRQAGAQLEPLGDNRLVFTAFDKKVLSVADRSRGIRMRQCEPCNRCATKPIVHKIPFLLFIDT